MKQNLPGRGKKIVKCNTKLYYILTILAINLQIINDCAGTDPGLPTAGTDPGRRYCIRYRNLYYVLIL